jgi:hypothetical protein
VDSRRVLNAARVYSQAVGRLTAGINRPDRASPELLSHHQKRTLDLLRNSLDLTPVSEQPTFFRERILRDAAFDPIRHTPGFNELGAKYGQGR